MQNSGEIIIRKLKHEDIDEVVQLIHHTLIISNKKDYSKEVIDALSIKYDRTHILGFCSRRTIFIASTKGKIVGTISLEKDTVYGLFVVPGWQGKGVGKMLLQFVEKYAFSRGITHIILSSSLTAYNFYYNNGYIPLRREENRQYGDVIIMKKMFKERKI